MTPFEEVLLSFPSADWDWRLVSCNPSVSFEFILEHGELPWVPAYVSCNPSVTEAHVKSNLTYPWVLEKLCANPNISISLFNEYIVKPDAVRRIDWAAISANPGLTMLDVISYPRYKWSDRFLSANPNLTSNYVLNEGKDRAWFVPSVSSNPGISERDIFKCTMKSMFDWDYRNLSANPNLPIAFVHSNLKRDWNYHTISSQVSMTEVHAYHAIPWDAHGLSMNPNISMDYILDHPELQWHAPTLLANDAITIDTFVAHRSWFSTRVSTDNAISHLSANGNVTLEWISRNRHGVDWKRLSSNKM